MNVRWKKLLLELSIWVVAEITLSLIGLDDLADYGEYVLENKVITMQYA